MDFQLDMPSTKQTRAMFTKTDKKCRRQFPIVPAKNMTAHKSQQGQTWPDCVVDIALGLKQVTHPTSTATTLLYTAGTRSDRLKNCLFDHIPLNTWLNLGNNKTHQALLKFEQDLRKHAKSFAETFRKHHLYDDVQGNTPAVLTPDQEAEWAEIQANQRNLSDRYAAKIEEFLYFNTETFLDTWFHKVCGVPRTDRPTKSDVYMTTGGTVWRRVEYMQARGIQH
jgi:hypothetical protein